MHWIVHSTVPFPLLRDPATVRMLASAGVGPEIYFSGGTLDRLTPSEAEGTAEALRAAGIRSLSFHAPFEDVWPGAWDEAVRTVSVRRISQAIDLAAVFRPAGIVLHGGNFGWLFDFHPEKWFEPARRSFLELADRAENASDAEAITPRPAGLPPTATGLSRRAGLSMRSTETKKQSRSR